MMERGGRKIILYSLNPFIGKDFTTGITEASFARTRGTIIY